MKLASERSFTSVWTLHVPPVPLVSTSLETYVRQGTNFSAVSKQNFVFVAQK